MNQNSYIQTYEIIKKIGEGSFSKVYLCKHIMLEGYRAIKVIEKNISCREDILKEAKMLQELECPFIPIVYDIFEDENNMYIVMEYIEGSSLYEIAHCNKIEYKDIIEYMISLCMLYEYFNERELPVVYIDLKPENIMVSEGHIKLVDFDSAYYQWEMKNKEKIHLTKKYTSPEQLYYGVVDEKTSIYSIGKILEFLLKHVKKCNRFSMVTSNRNVGKELLKIARKATAYYSFYRFSGVSSLKRSIIKLKDQESDYNRNTIYPIRIGVIGSQGRIGVTHLTFLMATYFNFVGLSSIYINYNKSSDMSSYLNQVKGSKSPMKIGTVAVTTRELMEQHGMDVFEIQLYDFSQFNHRDISMYESMDALFGVVGIKPWECLHTEKFLHRLSTYSHINFACNYASMEGYHKFIRIMGKQVFLRIPMCFDPFTLERNSPIIPFLEEIYDITIGARNHEKKKNT